MSELVSPSTNDIVYDEEPNAPWFVEKGPLVTWGTLAGFLLLAAFTAPSHAVISFGAAVLGFVLSLLVHLKWSRAEAGWYATFRWYRATVDKVIEASRPEVYKAAAGAHPQFAEVTLRMSNGHQLTFNQPVDWLLNAPAITYQAFYVDGELHHRFEQPAQ